MPVSAQMRRTVVSIFILPTARCSSAFLYPALLLRWRWAALNGAATRDIAILAGTDVLLLDGAAALTAPHLENLPVHNAVALAAGQFVYDRRSLLQLAVLTADGSLHILARPGLDAHALTPAEVLAGRRAPMGAHVSRYHVDNPASLGWAMWRRSRTSRRPAARRHCFFADASRVTAATV